MDDGVGADAGGEEWVSRFSEGLHIRNLGQIWILGENCLFRWDDIFEMGLKILCIYKIS